ncbi:MAG: hypothetical protein KDE29_23885, partial [Anaerolineales bacterium]|nr:hypothetical protein [Anaerolineales bacterium]
GAAWATRPGLLPALANEKTASKLSAMHSAKKRESWGKRTIEHTPIDRIRRHKRQKEATLLALVVASHFKFRCATPTARWNNEIKFTGLFAKQQIGLPCAPPTLLPEKEQGSQSRPGVGAQKSPYCQYH